MIFSQSLMVSILNIFLESIKLDTITIIFYVTFQIVINIKNKVGKGENINNSFYFCRIKLTIEAFQEVPMV